jgi:hypothetical protein
MEISNPVDSFALAGVNNLIPSLREASRKLVREWGFLQPTFAGSTLTPAAVHVSLPEKRCQTPNPNLSPMNLEDSRR